MYSHYYAIGIVGFEQLLLLGWLVRERSRGPDSAARWRRWVAADGAIALLYLPWLLYVSHTIATYNPGHGTPEIVWKALSETFQLFTVGSAFEPAASLALASTGVLVGLGLLGLATTAGRRALGISVGYQLAPLAFGLVSFLHTDQFGPRFIFIGSPGYYLILGGAILFFARFWRFAAIVPVAIPGVSERLRSSQHRPHRQVCDQRLSLAGSLSGNPYRPE